MNAKNRIRSKSAKSGEEIQIGKLLKSPNGDYRYRDFELPDAERDTIHKAVAKVSKNFRYPVKGTIGISGLDENGHKIGLFIRRGKHIGDAHRVFGSFKISTVPGMVDGLYREARRLIATYKIAIVTSVWLHISESHVPSEEVEVVRYRDKSGRFVKAPVKGGRMEKRKVGLLRDPRTGRFTK